MAQIKVNTLAQAALIVASVLSTQTVAPASAQGVDAQLAPRQRGSESAQSDFRFRGWQIKLSQSLLLATPDEVVSANLYVAVIASKIRDNPNRACDLNFNLSKDLSSYLLLIKQQSGYGQQGTDDWETSCFSQLRETIGLLQFSDAQFSITRAVFSGLVRYRQEPHSTRYSERLRRMWDLAQKIIYLQNSYIRTTTSLVPALYNQNTTSSVVSWFSRFRPQLEVRDPHLEDALFDISVDMIIEIDDKEVLPFIAIRDPNKMVGGYAYHGLDPDICGPAAQEKIGPGLIGQNKLRCLRLETSFGERWVLLTQQFDSQLGLSREVAVGIATNLRKTYRAAGYDVFAVVDK